MGRNIGQLKYEKVNNYDLIVDPLIETPTYIGLYEIGAATSEAKFQIQKLTATGLIWPNQNIPTGAVADDFKFVWDDRADYFA